MDFRWPAFMLVALLAMPSVAGQICIGDCYDERDEPWYDEGFWQAMAGLVAVTVLGILLFFTGLLSAIVALFSGGSKGNQQQQQQVVIVTHEDDEVA